MRMLVLLAAISLAAPSVLGVAGCGGEKKTEAEAEKEGGGEAAREEREHEEAAKRVPERDRVAYYQLTTTSGLVRARLLKSEHRVARAATVAPGELELALRRIRKLRPEDAGLKAARRGLTKVGRQSLHPSTAEARALQHRLDGINADLSRFLRRHPAQSALVPD